MIHEYPYSNFNEYNLDWCIIRIRELTDEWKATHEEWESVQEAWESYKKYFDTLDVQDEINNKINQMIQTGTFSQIVAPFFADAIDEVPQVVTDWINANLSQQPGYVIDKSLTVENAAADAKATGEIKHDLSICYDVKDRYDITDLVSGERYVSTGIQINADYKRAPYLYPVEPFKLINVNNVVNGDEMSVAFYDADGAYIERKFIYTPYQIYAACWAPKNAAYMGFSVKTINTNTVFTVSNIGDGKCDNIDRTFSDNMKSYLVMPGRSITQQGNLSTNASYNVIVIPNPNADIMYCSFNVASNGYCLHTDGTYSFLTPSTNPGEDYSRTFTIPADCEVLFITYPVTAQLDENGQISAYINMIRDTEKPLNKKKVACIGASATRMDQHSVSASGCTGAYIGWQKWLKWNGALVSNRGQNGFCYSTGHGSGSLYTYVVTNQLNIAGEDIIILWGGQNDAQYSAPIGTPPTDYSTYDTDPSSMCGAINGIMQYIRTQNPSAKVYMLTPYKSSLGTLGFSKVKQYCDAIRACAEFWSCDLIDMFEDCNIFPGINSSDYLYDGIHPNSSKGAELLGKIIAAKLMSSAMK